MLERKQKSLRIVGQELFKYVSSESGRSRCKKKNPINYYFADRQHTEIILRKKENKIDKIVSTVKFAKTSEISITTKTSSNNRNSGRSTKK